MSKQSLQEPDRAPGNAAYDVTSSLWDAKAAVGAQPLAITDPLPDSAHYTAPFPGLGEWTAPAGATVPLTDPVNTGERGSKSLAGIPLAGVLCALALAAVLVYYIGGTLALKNRLMSTTWSRYDTILFSLDFDETSFDYEAYGTLIGRYRIGSAEYLVVSPETILVRYTSSGTWRVITVTGDDDAIRFTPALTSGESYDSWYS